MQHVNKTNKCINPISVNVPPKSNVSRNPGAHRKTNHLIGYAKETDWYLYAPQNTIPKRLLKIGPKWAKLKKKAE